MRDPQEVSNYVGLSDYSTIVATAVYLVTSSAITIEFPATSSLFFLVVLAASLFRAFRVLDIQVSYYYQF